MIKKFAARTVLCLLIFFLVTVSIVAVKSAIWYTEIFEDTGVESIIFTLSAGFEGVSSNIMSSWIRRALIPSVALSSFISLIILADTRLKISVKSRKTGKQLLSYPFSGKARIVLCFIVCLSFLFRAALLIKLPAYIKNMVNYSQIYETEYVDPDTVSISFPEKKRNLIYIFLESMETTFFSAEQGGAMEENVIPGLYELAEENTNFSDNDKVGGFLSTYGTEYTVGGMVGQTAGIPFTVPISMATDYDNELGRYQSFLKGATILTDILHDNGYEQAAMFGSKASYGGRDLLFGSHGVDRIYDYYTAIDDGLIPEDYFVWWGFEDKYLYSYAEDKLTELSLSGKPFSFIMLTADTHFIGGYKCDLCEDKYGEQYTNVYACASRQACDFVQWIKEQPFYEDTTIVLCGDHVSMDNEYFDRVLDDDGYDRHVYSCIINSAASTDNTKNRKYTTLDLFPTVLASMGCEIEGDRLGLGVNLFSDQPTLFERCGLEWLDAELNKSSRYYKNKLLYDKADKREG